VGDPRGSHVVPGPPASKRGARNKKKRLRPGGNNFSSGAVHGQCLFPHHRAQEERRAAWTGTDPVGGSVTQMFRSRVEAQAAYKTYPPANVKHHPHPSESDGCG